MKWLDKKSIVIDHRHLNEYFNASNDTLSFVKATGASLQIRYLYHENMAIDEYHVPVIRKQLTKQIGVMMDDLIDEIGTSFLHEIPVTNGERPLICVYSWVEWKSFVVYGKIVKIVARITNRFFVGLPLCTSILEATLNL